MQKISTRLRGRVVVFHGYDGRDYTAHVESVRNGVARLLYRIPNCVHPDGYIWINAYIDDPTRIKG